MLLIDIQGHIFYLFKKSKDITYVPIHHA